MSDTNVARPTHTVEHIALDADQFVFLDNEVVDGLVSTVLELSAEVWALRRRALIVEKVMERSGAIEPGAVETYVPTAEDEAAWGTLRDTYVKRIFKPLARKIPIEKPPVPRHEYMD